MARMHARRKGKSSSKHPVQTTNPSWANQDKAEVEKLIVQYSGQGLSTAVIGIRLRDMHNVPSVKLLTGKSISQILAEHNVKPKIPEDLSNLIKRAINLQDHLNENKKDVNNKRNLTLVEAKIRRLRAYYVDEGILSDDWKYSMDSAKLLVE